MKRILYILLALGIKLGAQTLTYSYIDPCTGSLKKLEVPSNGVTVTYYNQIKTFSKTEILNGGFETWASGVFNQYGQNNPCGTAVGLTGVVDVAQGTAINVISLLNSLSAISDIQAGLASEAASGGMVDITSFVGSTQSSNNKEEEKKEDGSQNGSTSNPNSENNGTTTNNNNQNSEGTSQSNTSNNGSGSTSNANTPTNPSTNVQGGNSGTTNSPTESGGSQTQSPIENKGQEGQTNQQSNETNQDKTTGDTDVPQGGAKENKPDAPDQTAAETPKEDSKQTNVLGGAVSSIANASGKSEGNKPTVVLSSDFTGFNFKNNDVVYGGKATGGFTSMRWDGQRTHGFLVDYTSLTNGPNATAFYAFVSKKRIDLISVTGTAGFVGKGSLYGTVALGQMWNIKKNAKVIYLATTSWGQVFQEKFLGTAFITGGMYDWKVAKRVDVKMMGLFIYAPFVSYYNDIVLKSPYVVMPILGTNIGITKKFKFNINMGGTYAIKEDVMNFTIMMGTRFAL